jgi:peroxiredoxin
MAAWSAETSRPAPEFNMLRLNQPAIKLSQYRGKVVALVFILTTCGHCQQFTVELNQIAREYERRGVQILECAFNDEAAQTLLDFQERFTPPFPVTFSTSAAVSVFMRRTIFDQRPLRVPYLVLIDKAGTIREEIPGESEFFRNAGPNLRAALDKIIGAGRK